MTEEQASDKREGSCFTGAKLLFHVEIPYINRVFPNINTLYSPFLPERLVNNPSLDVHNEKPLCSLPKNPINIFWY